MLPGMAPIVAGAGLPWTPAELAPAAWYDANLSPKTFSTGTQVSQWGDLSANARHAAQSTSANQPIYSEADGWLAFDGSNDEMNISNVVFPAGNTAASIISCHRWITNTADKYIFSQGSENATRAMYFGTRWDTAGRPTFSYHSSPEAGTGSYSTGVDYVMIGIYNQSTLQIYINGTLNGSATYGSANLVASASNLGRGILTGRNWNGRLRSFVAVRAAITTDQRQRVEGYLAHRWGIAASLPSDHPYKAGPPLL